MLLKNLEMILLRAEYSILPSNAEQVPREYSVDRPWTWTGEGFVRVYENTNLSFFVEGLQKTGHFNFVIRYELLDPNDPIGWEDVRLTIVRPGDPSPDGVCANIIPSDDFLIARLPSRSKFTEVMPAVCLEAGVRYEVRLHFGEKRSGYPDKQAQALIDSLVIAPQTDTLELFRGSETNEYRKQIYDRFQCRALSLSGTPASQMPLPCLDLVCPMNGPIVGKAVSCDCDLTGSTSGICNAKGGQCECKPNVVGRRCDRCAAGTFGFGPSGCSPCDCDSVGALSNACDKQSGQCVCRERGITGRQCNQCQPGFWNFPECRTCQCNGHASICDQRTGACIDCRNLTDGAHCERCVDEYYGDPRLGVGIPCKACPCPGGPGSGYQHADTCYIAPQNQTVVCNCRHGYIGQYCDQCEVNFWGNPREIGGSCEKCHCHDNIDFNVPNSCDPVNGDCLKCLHNTGGDQCQHCLDGFVGDARIRTCVRCVCNNLGTNSSAGSCDRVTGQCPCFPNVIGVQCDQCAPLHYDLASEKGCSACSCDTNGVIVDPNTKESFLKCNDIDGQCHCKPGRGGRTCSDCQDLYWGDPVHGECQKCECDPYGSTTLQCHRQNGTCICKPGSGGPKCNECARGYTGQWPHCQACGECFDNWDSILQGLRVDLEKLVERALNIEDTGISSEYDEGFFKLEKQIEEEDLENLRQEIKNLQKLIDSTRELLYNKNQRVTKITSEVNLLEEDIRFLNESTRQITQGAFEIIEKSSLNSIDAERDIGLQLEIISQSETDRLKAEELLNEHKHDFDQQYDENKAKLFEINQTITSIGNSLEVCGAETSLFTSKVSQAKDFSNEAIEKSNEKRKDAEGILKNIREILPEIQVARQITAKALDMAIKENERIKTTHKNLLKYINEIKKFLEAENHHPEEISEKIELILNLTIPFNENQLKELSKNIRQKVAEEANNTEKILNENLINKTIALNLEKRARNINLRVGNISNTVIYIKELLNNASISQTNAEVKIGEISTDIEKSKTLMFNKEDFVTSLETRVKEELERVQKLKNNTDNLKAEYIKIYATTKISSQEANNASKIVKEIEEKHINLKDKSDKVFKLLEEKEYGNEEKTALALKLRKRSTELLSKIKRSRDEKKYLLQWNDSIDEQISTYKKTVAKLSLEIEQIDGEIQKILQFHESCDY
uniref:Laminin EGF-like domain-containing protein n=1 Tax=Meloidogyne hapla TaxID=6305 RepID=A0A1I8BDR2_MELHA